MANTLWSYATLGHDPGAQLLDAIAAHMCDRMHVFRPQAISNSLWVRRRCIHVSDAAHVWQLPICQILKGSISDSSAAVPTVVVSAICRRMRSCSTTRGASCWRRPAAAPWQRCTSTRRRWALHGCCTHWGPHTILIAVAHPREGSYMGNIGHHGSHTN